MTDQATEENIVTRLEAVLDYIRAVEGRMTKGEMVDLSGLDRTVGAICETIESAPKETAKKTIPLMERVIKNLDALAAATQKQLDVFQGQGKTN